MLASRHEAAFRQVLHQHLPGWVAEGLVSEEAAATLAERYAPAADASMQRLLITSIYAVGALLVGGGVISFVAANWAVMPAAFKVTLLLSAMLACHGLGYYWAFLHPVRPALGQALLVLGTLVFGANIGLFSQIFHLEGHFSSGFNIWALGAAAMALAIGSIPTATLAIAVALIAFFGAMGRDTFLIAYPILLWAGGMGFAQLYRAPFIAVLSLLAAGITASFYAGIQQNPGMLFVLGFLIAALYSGLGLLPRPPRGAYRLGVAGALFLNYLLSYGPVTEEALRVRAGRGLFGRAVDAGFGPYLLLGIIATGAVAAWVHAARNGRLMHPDRRELNLVMAVAAVLPALLVALGRAIPAIPLELLVVFAANLLLFAFTAVLLRQGVRTGDRSSFWIGLAILGLVIVSRFFEYDTGLLLKSLVFIACGVTVLVIGLRFEQRLRAREVHA